MDHKKRSKRSKVKSTNNKKKDVEQNKVKDKKSGKKEKQSDNEDNISQGSNQSFCEDQKDSNNIICKKDSDKYELKQNEAHKIDLHEDLECKPLDEEEGWFVKTKNKKKTSHQSLSEEQNNQKNIQKQSQLPDKNFKKEKAHDKNNIDSHKDEETLKSITKKEERWRDKNQNKNSREKSRFSDLLSIDDTFNQKKVHGRNSINLHKEDTQNVSIVNDSKGQMNKNKNKNKNSQEQSRFCDLDSSIDDTFNQKKVHDRNNIDSDEEDALNLSKYYSEVRMDKNKKIKNSTQSLSKEQKYPKKVQNQRKLSHEDFTEDNFKKKKAHNRINSDSQNDTRKSVTKDGEERWRDKNKNNNGQKQSRFSDIEKSIFEEIDEDIFNLSKDYSLAHCVAEDLRMGAGIAVDFKRIFGGVGKLLDQKLIIGDVGIVKRHDQYVFYLVTKKSSTGKPSMITMDKALRSLLNKMKENNLTKLGIPKIGCGLDKLDWSDTKLLINNIFSGSGIHITVCVPSKLLDPKKTQKLKVYITPKHLWEMEPETIIILFIDLEQICKKNWTDPVIDAVDAKYSFKENLLRDVKDKKLNPGHIKRYNVKNEIIFCIFTTQSTYYGSLEGGFKEIAKIKKYKYLAIESGLIDYPSDNFQHISRIVLILRSVITSSELWLCGDVKQSENQIFYDEYCKNVQYPMNNSFQYNSPTPKNYGYKDDFRNSFSTK